MKILKYIFSFALMLVFLMYNTNSFAQEVTNILKIIETQKQIDKSLLDEFTQGNYTLEAPFILVDPYGVSPLTAIMFFKTEKTAQISIKIHGDTKLADVDFTFDKNSTEHQIPIYGLYPNRVNKVTVTAKFADKKTQTVTYEVETEQLSNKHTDVAVLTKTFNEKAYAEGLNFTQGSMIHLSAFDIDGKWRWAVNQFPNGALSVNYNQVSEKGFFYNYGSFNQGHTYIVEINPLGRILSIYHSEYGSHHELSFAKNQTTLLIPGGNTAHEDNAVQDFIYELDLTNGKIGKILDYKDVLEVLRYPSEAMFDTPDWFHNNAIVEYEDDIIVSGNDQSIVMRNSWDGEIKWILSDPQNYLEMFEAYLLKPIGKGFEYPYNQHAVKILPDFDKNPNTVDIILFDNGTTRHLANKSLQNKIKLNKAVSPPLYSRIVHYRINEKDMTVEQIWAYGKERPELYGRWRGGAEYLKTGNYLGAFDMADSKNEHLQGASRASVVEVNKDKNLIWQSLIQGKRKLSKVAIYRAERLNIYTPNANNLRLGEEVKNFLPNINK